MNLLNKNHNLSAPQALARLIQGNARMILGLKSMDHFLDISKSKHLSTVGQWPFAIVLTCSDSRVPIELIFDRGLGDLFVIRTLGNVVDSHVIASIEYALLNFNIHLILVLGNSHSGAIRLTLENEEGSHPSSLSSSLFLNETIKKIRPSVQKAKAQKTQKEKIFQSACYHNVLQSRNELLKESKIIAQLTKAKELEIVPSIYDLDQGKVQYELHPNLAKSMDLNEIQSEAITYGKTIQNIFEQSILFSEFESSRNVRYKKSA